MLEGENPRRFYSAKLEFHFYKFCFDAVALDSEEAAWWNYVFQNEPPGLTKLSPLRNYDDDLAGWRAFNSGVVDTLNHVIVGQPILDFTIHVFCFGVDRRIQELIGGAAAGGSIDVITRNRIR